MDLIHQIEIIVNLFLQGLGGWLYWPMRLASFLGDEEFFIFVVPVLYWMISPDIGIRVGAMLIFANVVNSFFKILFHLPRPFWIDARVRPYAIETSFGIPSGHAQNTSSIFGLVTTKIRKRWFTILILAILLLIGISRLYLGMHFLTDVLMGWFLGGLSLFIFLAVERPVEKMLSGLSLNKKYILAVFITAGLICIPLIAYISVANWTIPDAWLQTSRTFLPDYKPAPLKKDNIFTMAGTWFGLMVGASWLYHKMGWFNPKGTPKMLILRFILGVAGVGVLWFGLGQIFPRSDDLISYVLRFIRYTLIGIWVAAVAPVLFRRFKLVYN